MTETALVFIKPEFVGIQQSIYDYFDSKLHQKLDFERTNSLLIKPSVQFVAEHYLHLRKGYPQIYESLVTTLPQGELAMRIYCGPEGLISSAREIVGPTDPLKASRTQIRGRFYLNYPDSMEKAFREGRSVTNVIHCSGNVEEGLHECLHALPLFGGEIEYLQVKRVSQ